MLRLPAFELVRPRTVDGVLAALDEHGDAARIVAGGTDLLPNLKHELFEPAVLVSLEDVAELRGARLGDGGELVLGAMTRIAEVAASPLVRARAPALSQAAGLIAGPQLRAMGTLGGNVMLETRCQWYNQTYFWRQALGFCLKKDGTACHVVAGGQKCVAAASNDTAPALMTLGARLVLVSSMGRRELPIDDLWVPDGIVNKALRRGELLAEVRVPAQREGHRGAYGKLRDRGSIDFPLLGLAARVDLSADGAVEDADLVAVALQARPVRVRRVSGVLAGTRPGTPAFDAAVDEVARLAHRQCHPLANVPGDERYRRRMVPVYARRTLRAAVEGSGPVHDN